MYFTHFTKYALNFYYDRRYSAHMRHKQDSVVLSFIQVILAIQGNGSF